MANQIRRKPPRPPRRRPNPVRRNQSGGTKSIVLIILAVFLTVLIVAEAAVVCFKSPGLLRKKPEQGTGTAPEKTSILREETGELNADHRTLKLCDVQIDADCLDFSGGSLRAAVADHGEQLDTSGSICHEYGISVGEQHQYDDPFALTFPCESPENSVILHFEEDYDMWMPLLSIPDRDSHTLTAFTSSFSDFQVVTLRDGLFVVRNAGTPDARLELSSGALKKLQEIGNPLIEETMSQFQVKQENFRLEYPEGLTFDETGQMISSVEEASAWWSLLSPLADTSLSLVPMEKSPLDIALVDSRFTPYTSDFKTQFSEAMTDISLLTMGLQVCTDSYRYGFESETTALNAYKNMLTNAGTFYSLHTGYSSAALSLGFLGVTIFSMQLDYMIQGAKDTQLEIESEIFNSYYKNVKPFDEDYWYNLYVDSFWDSNMSAAEASDTVKAELDACAEEFWRVAKDSNHPDFVQAVAESKYRNFFEISPEDKDVLSTQLKNDLRQRFSIHVLPKIERFLIEQMQARLHERLYSIVAPYNRTLQFRIYEHVDLTTNEDPQFVGCTLAFGRGNTVIKNEGWVLTVPDDKEARDGWELHFASTDYAWMCANLPDTLYIYKKYEDMEQGKKPLLKRRFKLNTEAKTNRTTTINLSESETYAWSLSTIIVEPTEEDGNSTAKLIFARADASSAYVTWQMKNEKGELQNYTDYVWAPGQGLSFPDNFVFHTYYDSESPIQQMNMTADGAAFPSKSTTNEGDYGHIHNGTTVIEMPDEGMTVTVVILHPHYRITYKYDAFPYDEAINRAPEVIIRIDENVWELQGIVYRAYEHGSVLPNTDRYGVFTAKRSATPDSYTCWSKVEGSDNDYERTDTYPLPGAITTSSTIVSLVTSESMLEIWPCTAYRLYTGIPDNYEWKMGPVQGEGITQTGEGSLTRFNSTMPEADANGNRMLVLDFLGIRLIYRECAAEKASDKNWKTYDTTPK